MRTANLILLVTLIFAATPARAQSTWLETRMIGAICDSKSNSAASTDRLTKRLNLTDSQKAALKELAGRKDMPPADLYQCAAAYALCSAAVRQDQDVPPAVREKLAEEYAHDALKFLRDAIAGGYQDAEHMKKDKDLDAVGDREEFKKLLAEVQAGKKKEKK